VTDGPWITIKNWQKYAPKPRNKNAVMPWIRVYRRLLEDRDYRKIEPQYRALLVDLWLLAVENDGNVIFDPPSLAWRLRADEEWLTSGLQAIAAIGFIKLPAQLVDDLSTSRSQVVNELYAEVKGSEGKRSEENGSEGKGKQIRVTEPESFDRWWSHYPRRAGGNSRKDALRAYRARVTDGVSPEILETKVREYAAYCAATDRVGTSYVQLAATWLNGKEGWLQDWTVPEEPTGIGHTDEDFFTTEKAPKV
jgi:hypothetical protein